MGEGRGVALGGTSVAAQREHLVEPQRRRPHRGERRVRLAKARRELGETHGLAEARRAVGGAGGEECPGVERLVRPRGQLQAAQPRLGRGDEPELDLRSRVDAEGVVRAEAHSRVLALGVLPLERLEQLRGGQHAAAVRRPQQAVEVGVEGGAIQGRHACAARCVQKLVVEARTGRSGPCVRRAAAAVEGRGGAVRLGQAAGACPELLGDLVEQRRLAEQRADQPPRAFGAQLPQERQLQRRPRSPVARQIAKPRGERPGD